MGYVTNGVHVPSWDSPAAHELWVAACGEAPSRLDSEEVERRIGERPDAELWAVRARSRADLVEFVRARLERQLATAGMSREDCETARRVLDPDALTIGLARRFTAYKRPTLLLRDPERLARLLKDTRRPVQIVVAGKAHPHDEEGKQLLRAWVSFARRADVRPHAVFLADYDLRVAERLVQGVDLWVNTPRPPWEACGTSGMKVLVNGGLNLSSLDGWWAEAYRPEVGWAIEGDGRDDDGDAAQIYRLLETEIVPAFYERDSSGIPRRWLTRVRASMGTLTPAYSAGRALREYTEGYYMQAAEECAARTADRGALGRSLASWEQTVRSHWEGLRFGEVRVTSERGRHWFAAAVVWTT